MKSKIAGVLALVLLLTALAIPTAYAYSQEWFLFTMSDKRGLQESFSISDTSLQKDTTKRYGAVTLISANPAPTHTIRTYIVNSSGATAVTNGVWYNYSSGSFVKPAFTSPASRQYMSHRAAMRLNTDETRDSVSAYGRFTCDWSN